MPSDNNTETRINIKKYKTRNEEKIQDLNPRISVIILKQWKARYK